jgi:hypothetical protein
LTGWKAAVAVTEYYFPWKTRAAVARISTSEPVVTERGVRWLSADRRRRADRVIRDHVLGRRTTAERDFGKEYAENVVRWYYAHQSAMREALRND